MKLSKTDFLIYRDCAHNAWVKRHRPDVYRAHPLSAFDLGLLEAGNEIDALAQKRFPGGILIKRGDAATTRKLVETHSPVLYQPVFETDKFTTACDVLVWDVVASAYDLYEVKASTSGAESKARNTQYLYDLGFQAKVLRQCSVPLGRLHLVRLDTSYVRDDALDIHALFATDDMTEAVSELRDEIAHEMDTAHDLMSRTTPLPAPCACMRRGRSAHCTTFSSTNPYVPDYSVHDITRIGASKKKLTKLIERGILDIRNVPDDIELSETQTNQVRAAKSGRTTIDDAAIAEFLDTLRFPLCFLDYETYPAAVPRFAGYRPYDQIPFQFSLDIVTESGAPIEHHEFLHTDATCPDTALIAALRRAMPATGNVITWNKSFEVGINAKLAERNLEARAFWADVNSRVVDLRDVFSGQAYVDPGFRGRTSIKAILPVLMPELSYKALAIQEGATATAKWNEMVSGDAAPDEVQSIRDDLLTYCALDTKAMVEIWRVLVELVGQHRGAAYA